LLLWPTIQQLSFGFNPSPDPQSPLLRAPLEPVYFACVCWSRFFRAPSSFFLCFLGGKHISHVAIVVLRTHFRFLFCGQNFRATKKVCLSAQRTLSSPGFGTIFICTPRPRKSCADMASKIVAAVHNKKIRKRQPVGKNSGKFCSIGISTEKCQAGIRGK